MDFNHTQDRRMLADTLRRYLSDQYTIEARNEVAYAAPYHAQPSWTQLAELGILGVLVDEQHGGFGGRGFDIAVVFEELGRALCVEPMLAATMSLSLLAAHDANGLITDVTAGSKRIAFAVYEPDNFDTLTTLETAAVNNDGNWTLSGRKSAVYGAPGADVVLVAATTGAGLGLFAVETSAMATFTPYAMMDGGGAAELTLSDTPAECLATDALAAIETALDVGRLALCAEAVGAMDVLLNMTVEYLAQRQQFGQPIATFQALQHRIVDMAVEIEQARSITILAASKVDDPQRSRYTAMAKNLIGRAATLVAEEATQLHGGIGMTWEYAGAHYTKRLIMLDHQLGDRYQQLNTLLAVA